MSRADEIASNRALGDEEWHGGRTGVTCRPRTVTIETTSYCNLACVMCRHGLEGGKGDHRHFPEEWVEKLAPILEHAEIVQLHGIGEPLMNPAFWKLVALTDRSQYVAINTNGLLVNDRTIPRLLDSPLSEISFSLDAATAETYRKIRGADFDEVIGNLERLLQERNRRGQKLPAIHLNMTLMRENIEETPAFIRLAARLGVDKALFWHMNSLDPQTPWVVERDGWRFEYHEQELRHYPALSNRMIREAVAVARELGLPLEVDWARQVYFDEGETSESDAPTPPVAAPTTKQCGEPWLWMLIQNEGSVKSCCFGPPVALGTLANDEPLAIWNGKAFRRLRANNLAGRIDVACAGATCKFVAGRPSSDETERPFKVVAREQARALVAATKKTARALMGERLWASLKKAYRTFRPPR